MSKGKGVGGRPRTVHTATNEEEVEFVLKGWPPGNASQPSTGFQAFAETRYFLNLGFPSSLKSKFVNDTIFFMASIFRGNSIGSLTSSLLTKFWDEGALIVQELE